MLCLGLVYFFSDILLPFFIGIFIAYLLDPLVDKLEVFKLNRGLGAIIVLIGFFSIILVLSLLILPILLNQSKEFLENFPNIIIKIQDFKKNAIAYISENVIRIPKSDIINSLSSNFSSYLRIFLNNILISSYELINFLGLLIITPIVSWYLLKDWDKLTKFINRKMPSKYNRNFSIIAKDIDSILSNYMRGQFLIVLLLSVYYCIFFTIMGLKYSLFIGFFTGFFSFIPIFGLLFSFLITGILVFLQFVDALYVFYIALIFLLAQILESYLLTPLLIGKKLGLHPLIIILSIFLFGSLLGILGIIFAIPLASIISIFLNKWIKYLHNE